MLKELVKEEPIVIPIHGYDKKLEAISLDGKEKFVIDINRKGIIVGKFSLQKRYKTSTVLIRFDMRPHTNPDGKKFYGPHIHILSENMGDREAIEVPQGLFRDTGCMVTTVINFLDYCRVQSRGNTPVVWRWDSDYPD